MCFSFSLSSSPALTPNTLRNWFSTDSAVDEFILWRKGIKIPVLQRDVEFICLSFLLVVLSWAPTCSLTL